MACTLCHVVLGDDMQLYNISDFGVELTEIIARTCTTEVDQNSQICEHCFETVTHQLSLETVAHQTNVCIWCYQSISGRHSHSLPIGPERDFIASRILPHQIQPGNRVCYACWLAARRNVQRSQQQDQNRIQSVSEELDYLETSDPQPGTSSSQPVLSTHSSICVWCERSIVGRHSHSLPHGLEKDFIAQRIIPRQIEPHSRVCYACWLAACRNVRNASAEETEDIAHIESTIQLTALPNFKRTGNSSNRCFVHGCTNSERIRVPTFLRYSILKSHHLYVTENARICHQHLCTYDWNFLNINDYITQFSPSELEGSIKLALENNNNLLNFEKIDMMSDETCHYWTGLSKNNFMEVLNQTPLLRERYKKHKTALAIFLTKLRTGEPHSRIGQLFDMSSSNVSNILKSVRNILNEQFVPLHLGVGHYSRNEIINNVLTIPQGLFGGEEGGNRRAIVICDGTYVYLQKSSNYFFQKKSYSLHKYRNLLKPFLIVTTDGHILDIYGPYAATATDAEIMIQLFSNENNELRQYFREGDVFILDRGFRDSIDLLSSLNYNVYKPESLEPGETQLPTLRANKSRYVTMCRWVVEVVNGRFKRDFKIYRNDFSNNATTHAMIDFRIAGAIINAFHVPITNRTDAPLILERALQRLNLENILADYVIQNNMNRQRAVFNSINAEGILLDEFPVMTESDLILFALGTYQIKQARSYYGEHIRQNGSFDVEVCRDTVTLHIPTVQNEMVLVRGRIKSRHISGRIYYIYILLNTEETQWEHRINGYYCSCIVGKRTVGCCAHTMTIVWYMGWARHHTNITAPAAFLDSVLITEDDENE